LGSQHSSLQPPPPTLRMAADAACFITVGGACLRTAPDTALLVTNATMVLPPSQRGYGPPPSQRDYGPPDRGPQLRLDLGGRREEGRYSPPNPAFKTFNNCPPNFTVQAQSRRRWRARRTQRRRSFFPGEHLQHGKPPVQVSARPRMHRSWAAYSMYAAPPAQGFERSGQ
jgi:hypothetical protein